MSERPTAGGTPTETLVRGDGRVTLRSRKIAIEVTSGADIGLKVELPGPEARIGSAAGCDLVFQDPKVSRHHATIRVDEDSIRICDAASRNGTWLDGIRVVEAYARPDSVITVGRSSFRLQLLSDVVELPLSKRTQFGALLGASVPMRRIFSLLERVAPTDTTLLVEGETGTGKELVAEAVHDESARAEGPFVVFDCSAVSQNLIESELFGHVRGAFTGASADRTGAFEAADGGTLFLDEIGELPLDLQPKLLRALERLEVRRVGSNQVRKVDVRVIAATNRSLATEVERNHFREDLYYRLAVVHVVLPPLRERVEDIRPLVAHFEQHFRRGADSGPTIPERMKLAFEDQRWNGNVRELRNAVARALSLGPTGADEVAEIASPPAGAPGAPVAFPVDLSIPLMDARQQQDDELVRSYVEEALRQSGGNVSRAAELAGVHRKFIHRAINRYKLRADREP